MSVIAISDYQVLSMKSTWIGGTQVRVKVREIGKRRKLMVDMFILRPEHEEEIQTSALVKIANNAVAGHQVTCFDKSWIRDFSVDKKAEDLQGVVKLTHVREITLAYQGY